MKLAFPLVALLITQVSALAVFERNLVSRNLEARTCGNPVDAITLFRAYSAAESDHLFTTSAAEIQQVTSSGRYTQENVAGKVFAKQELGTIPLYRLYSLSRTDHHYTTSATERDQIVNDGYSFEGIAGYVYPDSACGGLPLHRLYHPPPETDHHFTMADWEIAFSESGGYVYEGIAAYIIPT